MKNFFALLCLLLVGFSLQAKKLSAREAEGHQTIDRYFSEVRKKDFKYAQKHFSAGSKELSEKEFNDFSAVLEKVRLEDLQQEVIGLKSYPFRGMSINLEQGEDGTWKFTQLTRENISEYYALAQKLNSPEQSIAHFLSSIAAKDYSAARSSFERLIDPSKDRVIQDSLSKDTLIEFASVLEKVKSQNIAKEQSASLASYELIKGDKSSRIFLHRDNTNDWHFSPDTARKITPLHDQLIEHTLGDITPKFFTQKIIFMKNWQWLAIIAIILIGVFVQWLLQFILKKTVIKQIGRSESYEENRKAYRSVSILSMALSWYLLIPVLKVHDNSILIIKQGTLFVALVAGLFVIAQVFDLIKDLLLKRAESSDNKVDDVLVPMGHKVAKVLLFIVGTVFIAGNLGINVASLLAGLGIGGLAFALAAKDTVENIFGSLSVLMDKPFEVGDWVVIGGVEGTVESIGLRSTRIRTFYCSQVNVPNSTLIRATVDNYGRRSYRRIKLMLGLTYDTPPEKIEAFCEGVRELVRQHPHTRKDYYHVYLNNFSASSLDVLLYCFIDCSDWAIELREKQRLFLDIIRLAARLEVSFAYPTQTLYMAKPEDDYDPITQNSVEEINKAVLDGRNTGLGISKDTLPNDRSQIPSAVDYAAGNAYLKN